MAFKELELHASLRSGLHRAGYHVPTPIQAQAIGPICDGQDVLGLARTGTGKTAAYVIPVADQLLAWPVAGRRRPRAIVLCPTRELAVQVAEEATKLLSESSLRVVCVHGKVAVTPQLDAIDRGVDLLVATPGRMLELLGHHARPLDLSGVRHVVLDEADRMLDMGFEPQVRSILESVPVDRQTLFFSATFPPEVEQLARALLRRPVRIEADPSATAAPHVEQHLVVVPDADKAPVLMSLLAGRDRGDEPRTGVLVFCATRRRAGWVAAALSRHGFGADLLHGDRSHGQRQRALERFRRGEVPVLIATDVAARGLHIDAVRTVVNYDLAHQPEEYVHRIGRAGHGVRGRRSVDAFALLAPEERGRWDAILSTVTPTVRTIEAPPHGDFTASWRDHGRRRLREGRRVNRPVDVDSTAPERAERTRGGKKKDAGKGAGEPRRSRRGSTGGRRSVRSSPVGNQKPGGGVRRIDPPTE